MQRSFGKRIVSRADRHRWPRDCDRPVTLAVVIGDGTPNFERFLLTNEPTFDEFLKSHPLSKQIGQGATFRPRIFARIAREYRLKLADKSFR